MWEVIKRIDIFLSICFRPLLFTRQKRNWNPSKEPGKVREHSRHVLVKAMFDGWFSLWWLAHKLTLFTCSLQEASHQKKSSSMLTESVPVTLCVLLSTGCQVCVRLSVSHTGCMLKVHVQLHSLLSYLTGDPRRPYPTDLEMRSGMLGHMANLSTNGVNGHLPGDALAAGRLPGKFSWALKGRSTHASWQRDFRWGQRFVTVISKCIIYHYN